MINHERLPKVDIYNFCTFRKTGITKTIEQAHKDGDWIKSFNLWIVQRYPEPAILYQQRSFSAHWSPGLLDVSVGGHYEAGEEIQDGMREVQEEIGKSYKFNDLRYLGHKLYFVDEGIGEKLRYIIDVFLTEDNKDLSKFRLQKEELEGIYICPVRKLLEVHRGDSLNFIASGIRFENNKIINSEIEVNRASFPYSWDNYHYKMAVLVSWYFRGETSLIY